MKKQFVALALASAFVSAPVMAGFKLPGLPAAKDKPAQTTETTPPPNADALVVTFSQSQGLVLKAQETFASALGMKDEVTLLQAEQKAMASGAVDVESMKKRKAVSESTQQAIDARMAAQPELTAAARTEFSHGLVDYLKAVVGARNLLLQAQQFTGSIGANPLAVVGKAKSAMYVGKETPGYVKNMAGTTKALLAYAKRNNIETPKNATAALDGL